MALQLYDTLSKSKRAFEPFTPGKVRVYCCGPTVYDLLHIGNFRGPVVMNLLVHWLKAHGYDVCFVSNFTDVDDKIIDRAKKLNENAKELANRFVAEYWSDYDRLGLERADLTPKVTESMDEIIGFISELVASGKAYATSEGDVLFSVRGFAEYGKLSHRELDDMVSGEESLAKQYKKDPLDFALWKAAKPGEPSWASPWGEGRPGWHIECSAMIRKTLGDVIDIHGGGMDLIFPHHENEVAQTESLTGHPFVRHWIHWNMIQFGERKMSKSLGNVISARQFLSENHPELLKMMMLSVHHRSLSDFSPAGVARSLSGLARIYSALASAERTLGSDLAALNQGFDGRSRWAAIARGETGLSEEVNKALPPQFASQLSAAASRFAEALDDDLNTPEAMAEIFGVVRAFNALTQLKKEQKLAAAKALLQWVRGCGSVLSLFQQPAESFLRELDDQWLRSKNLQRAEIDTLVGERSEARKSKDFKRSDEIRDRLVELGISLQDSPEGTRWEVTK